MPDVRQPRWAWTWAAALALCAVLASVAWSLEIPGGGAAPDEQAHVAVARYFADHGTMPTLGTAGFRIELVPERVNGRDYPKFPYQPYATHPPGAYALSALWLVNGHGDAGPHGFRWSRTSQFLLAGLMTLLTFGAVRAMFPRRPVVWFAATTIVATWPELTFLFAYLNPDALATVAGTATIWAWFRGAARGWRRIDLALTGVALAAVVLSKPTAWPMIPLTFLVFATTGRRTWGAWLTRTLVAGVSMLVLAGPWMFQQMHRYHGDLTGIFVQRDAVRRAGATPIDGPSNRVSYLGLLTHEHWLTTTAHTFALAIPVHHTTVIELIPLGLLTLVSLCATVRIVATRTLRRGVSPLHALAAVLIILLAFVASFNAWRGDIVFQGQGRYLFPALVPAVTFAVVAALELLPRWWVALALALVSGAISIEAVHSLRAAYPGASAPTIVTFLPTCVALTLGVFAIIAARPTPDEALA